MTRRLFRGEANIINESGLFTLILLSREATKPGTLHHRFRKWVTAEVLPSIRKHGAYVMPVAEFEPEAERVPMAAHVGQPGLTWPPNSARANGWTALTCPSRSAGNTNCSNVSART